MNQYVNYFTCATDDSGVEIVIKARQTFPIFDDNGKIVGTHREDVASLVMTIEVARVFSEQLSDILNKIDVKEKNTGISE